MNKKTRARLQQARRLFGEPKTAAEARFICDIVGLRPIMGGDGTATKDELKGKLTEVNAEISDMRETAAEKWSAFEDARKEFVDSGADANNTDSEAFKKAEAIHKEFATVSEAIADKEAVRDGVFQMLASEAPGEVKASQEQIREVADQVRGGVSAVAERAVSGQGYKDLLESKALDSERRSFNAQLATMTRPEMKALITGVSDTSGGAFVIQEQKGYVPQPRRPLKVIDLITLGDTNSDTVEYVRQGTFTNVAAETAEATSSGVIDGSTVTAVQGGQKPEADITFEKVQAAVKEIAHWVASTRRALRDAGQLRTIIESQLRYGLDLRLDTQVVAGNGSGENLTGIVNTSGILTQAIGSDTSVDAIHKGITQIRLGFLEPTAVGLHPNDWQDIRLSKNSDGDYYYGPPALAGTEQVWGLPVAVTPAFSSGTGLIGDYRQAVLWLREAAQVLATDSHADFFTRNLVAVLAEIPAAFGVLMPAAFCKVTGI